MHFPTSTGVVHKTVTFSCVFMLVPLNKCGYDLQQGHSGDGCMSLSILFKYESSRGLGTLLVSPSELLVVQLHL